MGMNFFANMGIFFGGGWSGDLGIRSGER